MKNALMILLSVFYLCSYGQVNMGGKPYSFEKELKVKRVEKNKSPQVELNELDFEKLKKEDRLNDSLGKPFRYGKAINVAFDLNNSGEWIDLENGDRIWRLSIHCPKAKSIHLSYSQFWIPKGGTLYIYDKNKTSFIGGFNKNNNRGTKENPSKFATGLVYSDKIILEYYEPKEFKNEGTISIAKIIYGYRKIQDEYEVAFGSATCSVNINCSPEGDDWQDEKTSVAKIYMNGYGCTGSLINNTRENGTPYFLTADHCIETNSLDAISDPDASDFIFYWNYESSGCDNGSDFTPPSTVGATVIANDDPSDFALLQLIETPYDLAPQIQAYFNGWDRQTPSGQSVGIHHPAGDIKKVSTDNDSPSSSGNRWRVYWDSTANGNSILYGGSSGSPLYNSQSRVVGQAWSVNGFDCSNQYANYGKFGVSWNNGSEARRRLRDWLDPDNSGVNFLNGTYCTGTEYITNTNFDVDTTVHGCTIDMQNVKIRNGADVTIDAANDVIINGEFEVELGSELEIK
jgi:lysyl endopeptidase